MTDPLLLSSLLDVDEKELPAEVRAQIVARGQTVVPELLQIFREGAERYIDGEESPAPRHALRLLGELKADSAIAPALEFLQALDADTLLASDIVLTLEAMGPVVVEPVLAAYEANTEPEVGDMLADVLAGCGARDERIWRILSEDIFADVPDYGAVLFSVYGDARAVPLLRARLSDLLKELNGPDDVMAASELKNLVDALEELNADLSAQERTARRAAIARLQLRAAQAKLARQARRQGERAAKKAKKARRKR